MSVNGFLSNLGDILGQQFYTGENKNKSAQLGSFANQYDRSAQRSYTEQGYFRNHAADNTPKQLDILLQEPEATVLVKKRAFASLAEHYRPDMMDKDEAFFMKCTKILFKNKAKQISSYEMLTKIAQVSTSIGEVDYHLLPILFGATDALSALGVNLGGFKTTVDQVRKLIAFTGDARYTSWIANPNDTFNVSAGEGTGVMEFTTMMNFSTTTSIKFNSGQFSISFADPYNLMRITNNDVEAAISDSVNKLYGNRGFNLLNDIAQGTLDVQKKQLNLLRAGRGVNAVRFIIEPGTFVGKRIRALIDITGFEIIFDASSISNIIGGKAVVDPSGQIGGAEIGDQGLNPEEQKIFSNIVSALYNNLSLNENARRRATTDNTEKNKQVNDLRKKMTLHYKGKLVIQPMDTISIFINSKKQQDIKITGGLQSALNGLKLMQGISNLAQGIQDNLNAYKGFSIEKAIFAGPDFPNALWLALRSQFVADKQGACVFSGFFNSATSRYSNGSYEVSAEGKDNASYFERGIINIRPSIDVYNGPLFDPLTPFKQKYDSTTGADLSSVTGADPELLDENKAIFQSAFIKNKNGPLAGSVPTEEGYFNRSNANSAGSITMKKDGERQPFYDPEGMIYRWKEGIASYVYTDDGVQPGNSTRGQSITTDPYAGQDIMNVLSLLITGEPYNYTTYYKATTQFNKLSRDPITKQDGSTSYFRGLRAEIRNNNAIYGDFVPFKRLSMDEASLERTIGNQIKLTNEDNELQKLNEERAALADRLALFSNDSNNTATIKASIASYDKEIAAKTNAIYADLTRPDQPAFSVLGNDISYEDNDDVFASGIKLGNNRSRGELRKKINFLTRRLPWKIRANEDQNLFIVDDSYDRDYDIQAFEKSISDFQLFKSDYVTAADQIGIVHQKLMLEAFCNTQGHIEIRSPKFNRIPSSVFNRMMKQKNEVGVQVFPQFLQDLFKTQIKDIYKQIETIEDRIRLYCFTLGHITDNDCEFFIDSLAPSSGTTSVFGAGVFSFLSEETNGKIAGETDIVSNASDVKLAETSQKLDSQTNLNTFSTTARARFLQSGAQPPSNIPGTTFKSLSEIQSLAGSSDRFNNIKARLPNQTFEIAQEFGQDPNAIVKTSANNLGILQITSKIANLLSDRQKAIKTAANAVRNLKEGASLQSQSGANDLLFPNLSTGNQIPSVLEHMIEDESYDDLGVGSKNRYILKNHDIIDYSITEKLSGFSSVTVVGKFGDNFIPDNQIPELSSGIATAVAVDYDLWRMYGISIPQSVDAPFLGDPAAQLAPYAVSILNKARKEIFQGNINLVGNEFQQPGEVVYVENDDLLFYVESVSHSFGYGKSFTTSINVGYGHNPGEYIPTPLDIIGKVLYKNNKALPRVDIRRQGNAFKQENLGAVIVGLPSSSFTSDIDIFSNSFSGSNKPVLEQVINSASTILSQKSDTFNPVLELRVYINSKVGAVGSVNATLSGYASDIRSYLVGAKEFEPVPTPSIGNTSDNKRLISFDKTQQIRVQLVDSSTEITDEFRYPSRKAFFLAKEAIQKVSSGKNPKQTQIDSAIYNYVVDFWIVYENPQI